jgi:hypothetical protein
MKKACLLAAALAMIFSITGNTFAQTTEEHYELAAIGGAKMLDLSVSIKVAESRAHAGIINQIVWAARTFIEDYFEEHDNSVVSLSFVESVARRIAMTRFTASIVAAEWQAPEGTSYCLVLCGKAQAAQFAADIIVEEAARYPQFKALARAALDGINASLSGLSEPIILLE